MATKVEGDQAQAMKDTWTVRRYLEQLEQPPRRDPRVLARRLEEVQARLSGTVGTVERVELTQRRLDLEAALAAAEADSVDHTAAFIDSAARYSERRGITWPAWREIGVPAAVLRAAGVPRTR